MIQEFKTSKGEFALVKVPEDSKSFTIANNVINDDCPTLIVKDKHGNSTWIKMPFSECEIVGEAFELTEEQVTGIVEQVKPRAGRGTYHKSYDGVRPFYATAKQSFESLIRPLEVYKANPLGEEPLEQSYSSWPEHLVDHDRWLKSERRTGSWILIKKS